MLVSVLPSNATSRDPNRSFNHASTTLYSRYSIYSSRTRRIEEPLAYVHFPPFLPHSRAYTDLSKPTTEEKYSASSQDLSFSGIVTFAHLPHQRCLDLEGTQGSGDIIVLGMPFDTAVSYRSGARFGPNAIRQGSRRHAKNRAYSIPWNFNPLLSGPAFTDCGDIPISPYDNELALAQIETAYTTLLNRPVTTTWTEDNGGMKELSLSGQEIPKIISLGGDRKSLAQRLPSPRLPSSTIPLIASIRDSAFRKFRRFEQLASVHFCESVTDNVSSTDTIVLPILRSLHKVYGPISVIVSY